MTLCLCQPCDRAPNPAQRSQDRGARDPEPREGAREAARPTAPPFERVGRDDDAEDLARIQRRVGGRDGRRPGRSIARLRGQPGGGRSRVAAAKTSRSPRPDAPRQRGDFDLAIGGQGRRHAVAAQDAAGAVAPLQAFAEKEH